MLSPRKDVLSPRFAHLEKAVSKKPSYGCGRVLTSDLPHRRGTPARTELKVFITPRSSGNKGEIDGQGSANRVASVNTMNTERERRVKTALLAKNILSRYKPGSYSVRLNDTAKEGRSPGGIVENAASSSGFSSQDDEVACHSDASSVVSVGSSASLSGVKNRTTRYVSPSSSYLIESAVDSLARTNLSPTPDQIVEHGRRLPGVPATTRDGRTSADSAYSDGGRSYSGPKDTNRHKTTEATTETNEKRGWDNAVQAVRQRVHSSKLDHLRYSEELENLRKKLEETSVSSHSYQAEIAPLKAKIRRYEAIIEDLESKVLSEKNTSLQIERRNLVVVTNTEKRLESNLLAKEQQMEQEHSRLKQELHSVMNEVKRLEKELSDKTCALDRARNSVGDTDDEVATGTRSVRHVKEELSHVRKVLEDSEQDRLKERREKLSAIQNMIRLTKEKSELEEELDERKKSETKESGDKFARMSVKLSECEGKLQKLRQQKASELEDMQRKYMEEIRQLKVSAISEKEVHLQEIEQLKDALVSADFTQKSSPSKSPANSYQGGRWSTMKSADHNHSAELKEISGELEKEGLGPNDVTSDEIVRVLFRRWKEAEQDVGAAPDGNMRISIESLRDEKRTMKRKIEELHEAVASKDGQMKVIEMSLRRQIEDLLAEKKSAFFQMQNAIDLADNARNEAALTKQEHAQTEQALNRRLTELEMMRENLLNVTNQLKMADADFSKVKRELSVKEAELKRVTQDLDLAQNHIQSEAQANQYATTDSEEKRRVIKDSESIIANLEGQVYHLRDNLASTELRTQRILKERDELKDKITESKMTLAELDASKRHSEETTENLQTQIAMLEESLSEKSIQLSSVSVDSEMTATNLAAAQHLLKAEESRAMALEAEVESLLDQLTSRENESERWRGKVVDLETTVHTMSLELNEIKSGHRSLEQNYEVESTTRNELEREISYLSDKLNSSEKRRTDLEFQLHNSEAALTKERGNSEHLEEKLIAHVNSLGDQARRTDELALATQSLETEYRLLERERDSLAMELDRKRDNVTHETGKSSQLETKLEDAFQRHRDALAELANHKREAEETLMTEKRNAKMQATKKQELEKDIKMASEILLQDLDDTDAGRPDSADDFLLLVETMSDKLRNTQKDLQRKELEVNTLKEQSNAVSSDLAHARMELSRERARRSENTTSVVEAEKAAGRSKVEDVTRHLHHVEEERNQMKSQLMEVSAQLRSTAHQLRETEERQNTKLLQVRDAVAEERQTSQRQIEDVMAKNERQAKEIQFLEDSLAKGTNDLASNQTRLLESAVNDLRLDKECLEAKCQDLESALDEQHQHGIAHPPPPPHEEVTLIRRENAALLNDVASVEEENARLRRSLKKYHHRLRMSNKNIGNRGKENDKAYQILCVELEREHNEKLEALDCLKALVRDNEVLTNCIGQLHSEVEAYRSEATKCRTLIGQTERAACKELDSMSRFKDMMESNLKREQELNCKEIIQLKALLADKRAEVEQLRLKNVELDKHLTEKDKQLNVATSETFSLRATMEVNIGSQLLQSRNNSFTSKHDNTTATQERGSFLQKMSSLEMSNHYLQNRLMEMQKWHHAIEVELVQSSPRIRPLVELLRNSFSSLSSLNSPTKDGLL